MDIKKVVAIAKCAVEDNKEYALNSLEYNGIISVKDGVKPSSIIDTRVIPYHELNVILSIGGDSVPIPVNYRYCGQKYRDCLDILFKTTDGLDDVKAYLQKEKQQWEELFKRSKISAQTPQTI